MTEERGQRRTTGYPLPHTRTTVVLLRYQCGTCAGEWDIHGRSDPAPTMITCPYCGARREVLVK